MFLDDLVGKRIGMLVDVLRRLDLLHVASGAAAAVEGTTCTAVAFYIACPTAKIQEPRSSDVCLTGLKHL